MSAYQFRPISTWPGEQTQSSQRKSSPFGSASHSSTTEILKHELAMIGATDVVIELALREQDIRLDGLPRATAQQPSHPGVVVSFNSKYGPLRYATDAFRRWEINLRAIALGLQALRRVERYGITKRGEQYVGWRQIGAASQSVDEARAALRSIVAESRGTTWAKDANDEALVRAARFVTHPDRGGDRDGWDDVQHAAETLGVA